MYLWHINWNFITLLKCFYSCDIFDEYIIKYWRNDFFLLDINMQLYSCFQRFESCVFFFCFPRERRTFPKSPCSVVSRPSFCLWCNAWRLSDDCTRDSEVFKLLSWVSLGFKLLLELKKMFDRHYLLKSDSKLRNKNFMYANF